MPLQNHFQDFKKRWVLDIPNQNTCKTFLEIHKSLKCNKNIVEKYAISSHLGFVSNILSFPSITCVDSENGVKCHHLEMKLLKPKHGSSTAPNHCKSMQNAQKYGKKVHIFFRLKVSVYYFTFPSSISFHK